MISIPDRAVFTMSNYTLKLIVDKFNSMVEEPITLPESTEFSEKVASLSESEKKAYSRGDSEMTVEGGELYSGKLLRDYCASHQGRTWLYSIHKVGQKSMLTLTTEVPREFLDMIKRRQDVVLAFYIS